MGCSVVCEGQGQWKEEAAGPFLHCLRAVGKNLDFILRQWKCKVFKIENNMT